MPISNPEIEDEMPSVNAEDMTVEAKAYQAVIKAFDDEIQKLKTRRFMSRFLPRLEAYKTRFITLVDDKENPNYLVNLSALCQDIDKNSTNRCLLIGALRAFAILAFVSVIVMGAILMPAVVIPAAFGAAITALIGVASVSGLFVAMGGCIVGSAVAGRKEKALDNIYRSLTFFKDQTKKGGIAPVAEPDNKPLKAS